MDTDSGAGDEEGEDADDDMTVNLREKIIACPPLTGPHSRWEKDSASELDLNHDVAASGADYRRVRL